MKPGSVRAALLASLVLTLVGCAAPRPNYWDKPGGTQEEFDRTLARCRMQLAMVPGASREGVNRNTVGGSVKSAGLDLQDAGAAYAFMNDCLTAEGWTLRR